MRILDVRAESWPLAKPFTISRGTKTTAEVVVVELEGDDGIRGRAECVPYPRYDETLDGVIAQITERAGDIENGMSNETLHQSMPSGAARNALDCALWDLAAKQTGKRVWALADLPTPEPTITAETLSIGDPDEMGDAARDLKNAPLIKAKLNRDMIVTRMAAVRDGAPSARLIIDPNESWNLEILCDVAPSLADLGVEMIEQPLPAQDDHALADYQCPVDLCADESCHTAHTLPDLKSRYDMINIKLDKTGGLTEAIQLAQAADDLGFGIMVGCMVGTSLAMAPATLLSPYARFVDLDGPLLMKEDRKNGLTFDEGFVSPPAPELWG
jgi:L-Ala-D/L-Glu epimerase